jgi:hypothetical protein
LARLNVLTVLEGVLGKFANFWGYIDANWLKTNPWFEIRA